MNRKQVRGLPRGQREHLGTTFLFLFPFDFLHSAAGPPCEVMLRDSLLRVYPPFPNDGDNRVPITQVRLEAIPRLPNTTAPHINAPRLTNLRADGGMGVGVVRADALRIDLVGPSGAGDAVRFVDHFLEIGRSLTRQWWITRDRRFDEAYLRNSFAINAEGERLNGVSVMAAISGRAGIEEPLSRELFEAVVRFAAAERRSPLSMLMLCDALYYFAVGDMRRFVVEAGVASETALVEHALRHAHALGVTPGIVKRALDKPDFDHRLRAGCQRVYGRAFSIDRPEQTAWLEALWIARNNAAHGKTIKTRYQGRTYQPETNDYLSMSKATIELFVWLQQFGSFSPM